MPSSETFAVGKNLTGETSSSSSNGGSSNESLPVFASASPAAVKKPKKKVTDLRHIRQFARTHRVTLRDAVESIALSIMEIAMDNEGKPCTRTEFDALKPPKVNLVWYLWRIVSDLNALKEPILFKNDGSSVDLAKDSTIAANSGEIKFDDSAMGRGLRCLLFALIYVDRICQKDPNFRVNPLNVHRVMLGTMYTAHKFSDDAPYKLSHFSVIGGVCTEELKKIEGAVCVALEFNFYILEKVFHAHALAQLNFAVRGAHHRKSNLKQEAKNAAQQALDRRTVSIDDGDYGLGGSTPLMNAPRKSAVRASDGA